VWRDGQGRRVPVHPCASCGRYAPVMRYPMATPRQLGWEVGRRVSVINWCGHENAYMPRETDACRFRLLPTALARG
jgi:hypothetical protein